MPRHLFLAAAVSALVIVGCDRNDNTKTASRTRSAENTPANVAAHEAQQAGATSPAASSDAAPTSATPSATGVAPNVTTAAPTTTAAATSPTTARSNP